MAKTLFEKIWEKHVVKTIPGGREILYIDRHFIHEVTSPQAFNGLKKRGIGLRNINKTTATADHNVPTLDQHLPIKEKLSREQVAKLVTNCEEFGVELYGLGHEKQGIVHVIGPELGITRPGTTIVCGDSHTSTHGAFGAIAFGIGTSQVEQVMATNCLILNRPKTMRITINGQLKKNVFAKDLILYIIAELTAAGGTGYFVEYAGEAIESLSMEARMTICNMSIEMGARGGMIAPDQITLDYLSDKPQAPKSEEAIAFWKSLKTDQGATFDKEYTFDAADIGPMITYGTNPGMGIKVSATFPEQTSARPLQYMGLNQEDSLLGKTVNYVFIGSCTNSRIEDLRIVAEYVKGKRKAANINAFIVPGSKKVEAQAKQEGLDIILQEAGFEFREPGCSACLGMNDDKIPAGEYCVSTSNRNFEGRQGPGSRTFLASPLTAAATAIAGKIVDVSELD